MVRVAAIHQQIAAKVSSRTPDGLTPREQLKQIHAALRPLVRQHHECFEGELRQELRNHNIHILDYSELNDDRKTFLKEYFDRHIFPVLTPLAVDPGHPFPYISNLSLNLAVLVYDPRDDRKHFARVKVPNTLPRFIQLGEEFEFIPIEQAIGHNLEPLFKGMQILEYRPFRLTRNADLAIEEEEASDLLLAIEEELRKRRLGGSAVRLEITPPLDASPLDPSSLETSPSSASTEGTRPHQPDEIREQLKQRLGLDERSIYTIDGLLNLGSLFSLMSLPFPELKDPPFSPNVPEQWRSLEADDPTAIFTRLRQGDLLVHHPYDSFNATVLRFIQSAAIDPAVVSIKQTLYRTSGDSPVIQALIDAAARGKQVAVLVELKARFDEANNIQWAKRLEKAGVHVVYGLVGLKTHTKLSFVVRREDDRLRTYVHVGTGNYNPKTARLYTDLGLFTCDEEIGADVMDLFNFLTGYSRQQAFCHLLVAPLTLRSRITEMIRRETAWQLHYRETGQGSKGRIVAKMNSLVDKDVIAALYEAGRAGVEIDLIVRGICCLQPGLAGVSESIRVISVIGRFLEHSRIFYFGNGGDEEIYFGSADWMTRNLDRRVEAVTPVRSPKLVKQLQELLGIMLADNRQAWDLQADGSYIQRSPLPGEEPRGTHDVLMTLGGLPR